MKNFLDLLATNFSIEIDMTIVPGNGTVQILINGKELYNHDMTKTTTIKYQVPILQPIKVQVLHSSAYIESLKFDGWESRPLHGTEQPGSWQFTTQVPFYHWKHHATAQGWLLTPN